MKWQEILGRPPCKRGWKSFMAGYSKHNSLREGIEGLHVDDVEWAADEGISAEMLDIIAHLRPEHFWIVSYLVGNRYTLPSTLAWLWHHSEISKRMSLIDVLIRNENTPTLVLTAIYDYTLADQEMYDERLRSVALGLIAHDHASMRLLIRIKHFASEHKGSAWLVRRADQIIQRRKEGAASPEVNS